MATRIISLALALCFLLSACGGKEEPSRGRASLLAQAAELEEEETLLVIGGREVPAWRYLYWLGWVCDRLQGQYDLAEIPLDWEATVTGGTLEEYARDRALADTALYATVENWAKEYGVSLEESGTKTTLPEEGLTEAQMAELEEVGGLYAALYDLFCTEGSPLAPTEEVLRTFAETQGWLTVEQLLVPYGGGPGGGPAAGGGTVCPAQQRNGPGGGVFCPYGKCSARDAAAGGWDSGTDPGVGSCRSGGGAVLRNFGVGGGLCDSAAGGDGHRAFEGSVL